MAKSNKRYNKSFEELEQVASKFWPSELSEIEAKLSIVPLLLQTQDNFISVIGIGAPNLEKFFTIVEAASLSSNLFLRHLIILTDFGDQILQDISEEIDSIFPTGEIYYSTYAQQLKYALKVLPHQRFNANALRINTADLFRDDSLNDLQKDAIALLMYGSSYCDNNSRSATALARCNIGDYLGRLEAISRLVRQRYIWLSKTVAANIVA